jgi:alpha-galactosidase
MHRETGANVLGLCHGHYGYREIADVLGLDVDHVTARMPGFNHWIWMTDFRYRGEDAYPLLEEWIEERASRYWEEHVPGFADNQMSRAAIHQYRLFGLMPIGDTPRMVGWWYHTDLAEKKKWYGHLGGFDSEVGWGRYLDQIQERVEEVRRISEGEIPPTEVFPAVQSNEQIVPIIDSLVNDKRALYQVNIPNNGELIKGFPEDLVVEVQGVVDGSGIHGVSEPPLPPRLMSGAMIPRWHRAELLVNAVAGGDANLLLLYLLQDQRTRNIDQAASLADAWLDADQNAAMRKLFRRG